MSERRLAQRHARRRAADPQLPACGNGHLAGIEPRLVSPWLARKDADWWIDRLYDFAAELGATIVRTALSRTVIDVNRDPSGVSLYPGQATTELCPTTTFDGEPLYRGGKRRRRRDRRAPGELFRPVSCDADGRDRAAARAPSEYRAL